MPGGGVHDCGACAPGGCTWPGGGAAAPGPGGGAPWPGGGYDWLP